MDDVFVFPMSLAQERLWFIERLSPAGSLFNLSTITRLRGRVVPQILERSLNEIVRRHESLRTTFDIVDEVPSQIIAAELEVTLPVIDLTDRPAAEREPAALDLADHETARPFDLVNGPLVRLMLIKLSDDEQLLAFTIHHLVSDGWSMGQFWHELSVISDAFARGLPSPLLELDTQYADFAVWQRNWLRGAVLETQLAYWRDKLAELPPVLDLPADRPRPAVQSFRGSLYRAVIPPALVAATERLAHAEGATSFMVLLAALQTLLHRYTGAEDVVIGTYSAGRTQPQTEALIGFFLNTLVLRTDLSGEPTFREVVRRARDTALDAYAHQELPFATLVQDLHPDRDPSRNPLFQVMFQMINVPNLERLTSVQQDAAVPTRRTNSAFDISIALKPHPEGDLEMEVEYSTDLFGSATVERLVSHLLTLLGSALAAPDERVAVLAIMSADERDWLITQGQGAITPQPGRPDLCQLLAEQLRLRPDAVAYRTPDGELNYRELDHASALLAGRLVRAGAGPKTPVVVLLPRRGAHLVALWAILKCHAVYVPVAVDTPPARIRRILSEVQPTAVLGQSDLAPPIMIDAEVPVIFVDDGAGGPAAAPRSEPAGLDDLAYIIYTSGSTGIPKGVCASHRQVLNRLRWMWRAYPFDDGEVACHKTSISFVDSLWEMLGPLLTGVPTVVLPDELVRDPKSLINELAASGVTRLWLVPSLLRAVLDVPGDLAEQLPRLRFWVSSGEPLGVELLERFQQQLPEASLYNLYGTSEVWDATWWSPPENGTRWCRTPIGRPVDNVVVRVLDRHRQLVPAGVPGELYIGGDGLAHGYLDDPELTAIRFVDDPLRPGGTLYRSSDQVRWLPSGELEFISRADPLIKPRGYRIDPAEVEDALIGLPDVSAAVVVLRDDLPAGPRLVAYLVAAPGADPDVVDIRRALTDLLPQYMLPGAVVCLPVLPLTTSGKIDRTALPPPKDLPHRRRRDVGGLRSDAERAIAALWQELLETEVGPQDNFFDLGGHSLLLVQVHDRLAGMFPIGLSITDMFRYPTVASLATYCSARAADIEMPEESAPVAAVR